MLARANCAIRAGGEELEKLGAGPKKQLICGEERPRS